MFTLNRRKKPPMKFNVVRGGPLENVWGAGGVGAKNKKNIFAQGKIK